MMRFLIAAFFALVSGIAGAQVQLKVTGTPAANDCVKFVDPRTFTTAGGPCATSASAAPSDAHYVTMQAESGLSAETVLSAVAPLLASANAFTAAQTFTSTARLVGTFTSTDAGASSGPILNLLRNSASPAPADIMGEVRFSGIDSAANGQVYASILNDISNVTDTTETSALRLQTVQSGTLADRVNIGAGIQIGTTPTGGDLGIGKVNVSSGYYVNNVLISPSPLTGTTGSIGGGALLAGACASGTVAVTGSTTAMAVVATPATYPGDGADWEGYVSTNGTVTVKVCAIVAVTPTASAYNVRVIQ